MSYDVYAECPHCGQNFTEWNYTSNMSPAWRAAGCDIGEFDGKPAAELSAAVAVALAAMRAEPSRFREYDSPNGWGTMATLLPALERLREQLERVPTAVVRVSR